jgi:hypothetical protein
MPSGPTTIAIAPGQMVLPSFCSGVVGGDGVTADVGTGVIEGTGVGVGGLVGWGVRVGVGEGRRVGVAGTGLIPSISSH